MNALPRRNLLTGGVALAALAAPSLVKTAQRPSSQADAVGTVVVRWNASSHKWSPRPANADFGVVFLSTNDPHATPPTDKMLQTGDVWRRHPDAEEV